MDLQDYRTRIDGIDRELLKLFEARMRLCREIAAYKKAHGLPVRDAAREREKLQDAASGLPEDLRGYGCALLERLMELSRQYQRELSGAPDGEEA